MEGVQAETKSRYFSEWATASKCMELSRELEKQQHLEYNSDGYEALSLTKFTEFNFLIQRSQFQALLQIPCNSQYQLSPFPPQPHPMSAHLPLKTHYIQLCLQQ